MKQPAKTNRTLLSEASVILSQLLLDTLAPVIYGFMRNAKQDPDRDFEVTYSVVFSINFCMLLFLCDAEPAEVKGFAKVVYTLHIF